MNEFILYILICLRINQKILNISSYKQDMMKWWQFLEMSTMSLQQVVSPEKQSRQSEKSMSNHLIEGKIQKSLHQGLALLKKLFTN